MAEKIVIVKSGYNALTESVPNNMIFSSDYNTLKYGTSGTVNLNYVTNNGIRTDTYTVTVTFSAGFSPVIFAYINDDSYFGGTGVYLPLPYHSQSIARAEDFQHFWDENVLTFQVTVSNGLAVGSPVSRTAHFKYFIFKNETGLV